MNTLLTFTARTLVEHCSGLSEAQQASACDVALQSLTQKGCSQLQLRSFLRAVAREIRTQKRVIPARLSTPAGHAGADKARILSVLEKTLSTTVELSEHADPLLLGGATLAVGDERLDVSLRGALRQLHCHLTIS